MQDVMLAGWLAGYILYVLYSTFVHVQADKYNNTYVRSNVSA